MRRTVFDAATDKSVVLVDAALPIGLASNAVSVVGVSMGCEVRGLVGPALSSRDGHRYPGVVLAPLPILAASQAELVSRYLWAADHREMTVFPFSSLAQSCRTYLEYEQALAAADSADIPLSAVGIIGPKKSVNKMVGSFPLLR
ncbi:DUF2000 domain-containing protein [Rhodococcus sp. D2-41]|nr:DUF2000 domain-containing protein [Rhodococcus sp. D2-41]